MAKAKSGNMKILFFIDSLLAGGKERRLTELMKELKKNTSVNFGLVVMNQEIHYKEVLDLDITIHYLVRKTKKLCASIESFLIDAVCISNVPICQSLLFPVIRAPAIMGTTLLFSLPMLREINNSSSSEVV